MHLGSAMSGKIGIIGGTAFLGMRLFGSAKEAKVKTPYGDASVCSKEDMLLVLRHGKKRTIPPHMINTKANIYALKKLGAEKIIGVCSSGSLKKSIKPGHFVVPHDYMNFSVIPTYFDRRIVHTSPGLDEEMRKALLAACKKAKLKPGKGIYVQTRGPRLETKAEVKFLGKFADIVGMTMASEATCAKELGLRYAALCAVDNYANGVAKSAPDFEKIKEHAVRNKESTRKAVSEAVRMMRK